MTTSKDNQKDLPVILWDWDGVIANSNSWKWEGGAWEQALYEEKSLAEIMAGILEEDAEKKLTRFDLVEKMLVLAKEKGIEPQHSSDEYTDAFGKALQEGYLTIGLFDGVKEVLRELHELGHRMYVISAASQEDLETTAPKLGIDKYFISLNGLPGKKIEHADKIRSKEGSDTSYVVIGDGEGDRKLAEHIGCRFIGVVNEWNSWGEEKQKFLTVSDIREIPKALQNL